MNSTVRKIRNDVVSRAPEQVSQETGRVLAIREDGSLRVRTASGDHDARRAVSCLVAAEVDDVVLLARTPLQGAFVLAVLTRESDAATTLAVPGDLAVRVPEGRLTLAASEGVDLLSAHEVAVTTGAVRVNAVEGSVVLQGLTFLSDVVRAEIDRVKLHAQTFDSVVERLKQKVQRSYRTVTETDQLRAERIDYTAEKVMSLHAEHALVSADELFKVDAEQIHLG
ncbi:MAG: DUF3540 domain-containing protein [Minicystis sp.]